MGSQILRNLLQMAKGGFYAVARGKNVGVFATWEECKRQVEGYPNAKFKKFNSQSLAEDFLKSNGAASVVPATSSSASITPTTPSMPLVPYIDFWPDDVGLGEEDDFDLVLAASSVDPASSGSKRPLTSQSGRLAKIPRIDSAVPKPAEHRVFAHSLFPVDSEGYVLVYTDGSCEGNGTKKAIAGLGVYFDDNHPFNAARPVSGKATNNVGEIQAACEAIRIAMSCDIKNLCINTDSQFVINAITKWVSAWKRKNWRLSNGGDVKNKEDFQILDDLVAKSGVTVKWNYVKGHAGIKGNEEADKLARKGGQLYGSAGK